MYPSQQFQQPCWDRTATNVATANHKANCLMTRSRFHLAIPVDDLDIARRFYRDVVGLREGRSASAWVDFDLFDHQLVIHEVARTNTAVAGTNPVDGDQVPVPHFGVILSPDDFSAFATQLQDRRVEFVIEPHVRFAGEVGEQHTMFFLDPCGNALEFKAFADDDQVFATK